jgi:hypothetical protein
MQQLCLINTYNKYSAARGGTRQPSDRDDTVTHAIQIFIGLNVTLQPQSWVQSIILRSERVKQSIAS